MPDTIHFNFFTFKFCIYDFSLDKNIEKQLNSSLIPLPLYKQQEEEEKEEEEEEEEEEKDEEQEE